MNISKILLSLAMISALAPLNTINATYSEAKVTPIQDSQIADIGTEMEQQAMNTFKTIDKINFNKSEKKQLSTATANMVKAFNKLVDKKNQDHQNAADLSNQLTAETMTNKNLREENAKSADAQKSLQQKLDQAQKENEEFKKTISENGGKLADLEANLKKAQEEKAKSETKVEQKDPTATKTYAINPAMKAESLRKQQQQNNQASSRSIMSRGRM